jgi:hypothetical protein
MRSNANMARKLVALILVLGVAAPVAVAQQQIQTPSSGGGSGTVNLTGPVTSVGNATAFSTMTSNAFLTGNGTALPNQVAITGLVKGNGASAPVAYGGASCTNQFPRSLDLNGAATCATVGSNDLASALSLNGLLTATGGATVLGSFTANGFATNSSGDANGPATPIALLEFQIGRTGTGGLSAGQPVADFAFQFGGNGGGFRNWMSSWHDTVAATSQLKFYVNNSAVSDGSSAPGTGNALALTLDGNGNATVGGALAAGTLSITGTTLPTQAAGTLGIGGIASAPTLGANGEGDVFLSAANGLMLQGQGSSTDFHLRNANGTVVAYSATNSGIFSAASFSATGAATFGSTTPAHIISAQTTPPGVTTCNQGGGSPSIVGTDTAGEVTTGTLATSCVVTFNVAYVTAPFCVVTWQASLASTGYTISNTAITFTQTATTGEKVNYHCIARSGG